METVETTSWEEFLGCLRFVQKDLARLRKDSGKHVSTLLYRGHSDVEWTLKTTLDRYTQTQVSLEEYFRKAAAIKPRMETFTSMAWEYDFRAARAWSEHLPLGELPGYEYLVFLRQHGFPSPLLDWTASPQVAAFFAFRDTAPEAAKVSVYAYCEMLSGGSITPSGQPAISTYGPAVRSQLLQQSQYTMCTVFRGGKQYFAMHEDAVKTRPKGVEDQDRIWKFNIPSSERGKVLALMREFNLHPFSLFSSTESLAETLALEHFGPIDVARFSPNSLSP